MQRLEPRMKHSVELVDEVSLVEAIFAASAFKLSRMGFHRISCRVLLLVATLSALSALSAWPGALHEADKSVLRGAVCHGQDWRGCTCVSSNRCSPRSLFREGGGRTNTFVIRLVFPSGPWKGPAGRPVMTRGLVCRCGVAWYGLKP